MNKLVTTEIANLQAETTAVQALNANFDAIETVVENTLSRDGTAPNTMGANLDMNSHRVLNLPVPLSGGEPLRLGDLGGILPSDIANAGANASLAQASATSAAASALAAAGFVGSATQAPKWTTGRSITISGDVTGTSPTWDGTTNLTWTGVAISAGAVTSVKLATGAAVANIGYTPVNRSGDVLSGDLRLNFTASALNVDSIGFRGIPIGTHDATYSFSIDDCGRLSRHTSGSAHAWTINPTATTAYPIGTTIAVRNVGAGVVTITRGAGVTLRKAGNATSADVALAQWGLATMVHEATDTWVITGTGIT